MVVPAKFDFRIILRHDCPVQLYFESSSERQSAISHFKLTHHFACVLHLFNLHQLGVTDLYFKSGFTTRWLMLSFCFSFKRISTSIRFGEALCWGNLAGKATKRAKGWDAFFYSIHFSCWATRKRNQWQHWHKVGFCRSCYILLHVCSCS